MADTELAPCPFCGGEAHLDDDNDRRTIECQGCGATIWAHHLENGISAWNRRSSSSVSEGEMPLPEPRAIRAGDGFPKVYALAYTADQLREFGHACYRMGRDAATKAAAPADAPWHDAVLAECMRIETGYQPADPVATVKAVIDWHVQEASGVADGIKVMADNYVRLTCGRAPAEDAREEVQAAFADFDMLSAYNEWIEKRGPLGEGSLTERVFFAGYLAARRASSVPAIPGTGREKPACRMQGGICACRSGGSYGGCAIERGITHQSIAAPSQTCTCPSGDGSLRWPCPVHPSEAKAGKDA